MNNAYKEVKIILRRVYIVCSLIYLLFLAGCSVSVCADTAGISIDITDEELSSLGATYDDKYIDIFSFNDCFVARNKMIDWLAIHNNGYLDDYNFWVIYNLDNELVLSYDNSLVLDTSEVNLASKQMIEVLRALNFPHDTYNLIWDNLKSCELDIPDNVLLALIFTSTMPDC